MKNLYVRNWNDFPIYEVAPNNFRKSICGAETGVNLITVKHPMAIPNHVHDDAEQTMLIQSGRLLLHIDGQDDAEVGAGDIVVIPRGVRHWLESMDGECVFFEVFSPRRVQNLIGYIGKVF